MSKITIMAPISVGELLDKISILEIKLGYLQDLPQRDHQAEDLARSEYTLLLDAAEKFDLPLRGITEPLDGTTEMDRIFDELTGVNDTLWLAEDQIREQIAAGRPSQSVGATARSIVTLNDRRAAIKRRINEAYDSAVVEVKSYAGKVQS